MKLRSHFLRVLIWVIHLAENRIWRHRNDMSFPVCRHHCICTYIYVDNLHYLVFLSWALWNDVKRVWRLFGHCFLHTVNIQITNAVNGCLAASTSFPLWSLLYVVLTWVLLVLACFSAFVVCYFVFCLWHDQCSGYSLDFIFEGRWYEIQSSISSSEFRSN